MNKIRLINYEDNDLQRDVYVKREPKTNEYIYMRNGEQALVTSISQLAKNTDSTNEPDFVAFVKYGDYNKPALINLKE